MQSATCIFEICFVPLNPAAAKFFGFSEYLAALALMILVWTTTDVRSRFRIATAPLPLHTLSFATIAFVGTATLLTDLWRAEGWLVPNGRVLTPEIWQALLGGLFLMTFLSWGWFAFVSPPRYGCRNAQRFGSFLLFKTMEGNESELAILAQELTRSLPNLVAAVPQSRPRHAATSKGPQAEIPICQRIAQEIFLLIGDPRFCRAMVSASPGTIQTLFLEMKKQKRFDLPIYQFGRNVVEAAIENRGSFLYHEGDGFYTGLLGYIRPVSQAVFGCHELVHAVDALLDPDYKAVQRWSADQWGAFNRAVLITFRDFVASDFWNHSVVLSRAFGFIGDAARDIYKLDGASEGSGWEEDSFQRLRASVDFCKKALEILDAKGVPEHIQLRIREDSPAYQRSAYDWLADIMYDCIDHASQVSKPWGLSWNIQHNSVWLEFFGGLSENTAAGRIVLFKLRRKLYDEIMDVESLPNYVNVRILGYCLNVMGLKPPIREYGRKWRPLHKAVLAWTVRHYAELAQKSPQVFADSLPAGMSYDTRGQRLVKTFQVNAFHEKPTRIYLDLKVPPPRTAKPKVLRSRRTRGT